MTNVLTSEEFKVQFESSDFVLKTQRQIIKDFLPSSLYFSEDFDSIEYSQSEILDQISTNIGRIMKRGETQFLQLLYQIDIPQSSFLKLLNKPDFIDEISWLILKREAFKVYLRSNF